MGVGDAATWLGGSFFISTSGELWYGSLAFAGLLLWDCKCKIPLMFWDGLGRGRGSDRWRVGVRGSNLHRRGGRGSDCQRQCATGSDWWRVDGRGSDQRRVGGRSRGSN